MFKHSCYIENSQEAREWLTLIGIRLNTYLRFELAKYIYFYNDTGIACFINDRDLSMMNTETTDCTGNLPLFKALTAVRDDIDYMQEFVCIKSYKKDTETFSSSPGHNYTVIEKGTFFFNDYLDKMTSSLYRKATKEELIGKYKKK